MAKFKDSGWMIERIYERKQLYTKYWRLQRDHMIFWLAGLMFAIITGETTFRFWLAWGFFFGCHLLWTIFATERERRKWQKLERIYHHPELIAAEPTTSEDVFIRTIDGALLEFVEHDQVEIS